jgi:hypothetical protein
VGRVPEERGLDDSEEQDQHDRRQEDELRRRLTTIATSEPTLAPRWP